MDSFDSFSTINFMLFWGWGWQIPGADLEALYHCLYIASDYKLRSAVVCVRATR